MTLPKRKNHRLKNYDYGQKGYYYITICTFDRKNLLCEINHHVGSHALVAPPTAIRITNIGKVVTESFYKIEQLNENVKVDRFVLMPNHIHAIIVINNEAEYLITEKQYSFEISERRGRRRSDAPYKVL